MKKKVLSFLTTLLLCTPAWASYTNIYGGGTPNSSKFDIVFVEYDPSNSLDLRMKAVNNSDKLLGEHGATGTTGWIALKSSYVRTGYVNTKASTPDSIGCWGAIKREGLNSVDVCVLIDATNPSGQEYNDGSFFSNGFVYLVPSSDSYWILGHELGNMAGLADEYDGSYTPRQKARGFPNVYDHPSNIQWRTDSGGNPLITSAPVDGPTGWGSNVWRPYYSSVMRDSANGLIQQYNTSPKTTKGYDPLGVDVVKCRVYSKLSVTGYNNTAPRFTSITGLSNNDTVSGIITIKARPRAASPKSIKMVQFWMNPSGVSRCYKTVSIPNGDGDYVFILDTSAYSNATNLYMNVVAWDNQYCYTEMQIHPWAIRNPKIKIPIYVKEALGINTPINTNTLSGRERTNDPLTVGIPIPDSYNVTAVSQLGVQNATLQQFRTLSKWSSGNIQWVLVDTQVTLGADEEKILYLVSGSGNTSGTLATDNSKEGVSNNDYITVSTGTGVFVIRKSKFNFLDTVKVGSTTIVSSGNSGGLEIISDNSGYTTYKLARATHTIGSGTTYKSNQDSNSTATIEENGPARCVIKCTGSLVDWSANRFLDYIVRFHFYKNKSYVKPIVTIAHAKEEQQASESRPYQQRVRTFRSASIKIPTAITSGNYEFSSASSTWTGTIDSKAYMYQAFQNSAYVANTNTNQGDQKRWWYEEANPPMQTTALDTFTQSGVEVKNGTSTINALGTVGDYTRGWGEIKDVSKGMTIQTQWMAGYWPMSYDFGADGLVVVGILSKYNKNSDSSVHLIKMCPTSHETRKFLIDFHTSSITNLDVKYRLEQPVYGRSTPDHYMKTKAVRGVDRIVDYHTWMEEWWKTNYGNPTYGNPFGSYLSDNQANDVYRLVDWSSSARNTDFGFNQILHGIIWGIGGKYTNGIQKAEQICDAAIMRTDGFDWSTTQWSSLSYARASNVYKNSYNALNTFEQGSDCSHNQFESVYLAYFLTGEMEFKEAMDDYLEYYEYRTTPSILTSIDERPHARSLRTLALGWEWDVYVNQGTRGKSKLEAAMKILLNSRDNPGNFTPNGRNLDRGYIWMPSGFKGGYQHIHSFFFYDLLAADIWQVIRTIQTHNPTSYLLEDIDDLLTGMAQFSINEALFKSGASGIVYHYNYNLQDTTAYPTVSTDIRKDASAQLFLHGYKRLDDSDFIYYGSKLISRGGALTYPVIIPVLEFAYNDYWRPMGTYKSITPTVRDNGNNNYTLSFRVPANCSKLKIKYSNKPIVDWLGFNQVTRTYQYSPSSYTPWFSAWNYDSEPACGNPGTTQSFAIDIPTAISAHNKNRGWTIKDNEYINYNSRDTFYFQIRYLE